MGRMKEYLGNLTNEVLEIYENTPRFYCGYANLLDEYYDKNNCEAIDEDYDYAVYYSMFNDISNCGNGLDKVIDNLYMVINKSYGKCYNSQYTQRISKLKKELIELRRTEIIWQENLNTLRK